MFDDFVTGIVEGVIGLIMEASGTSPDLLKISDGVLALVRPLWAELCLFGIGLTLVFFIIELNKIYAFEGRDMNFKSMLKPFLKLGFAIVALSLGANIITTFLDWHNGFIDTINTRLNAYTMIPSYVASDGTLVMPTTIAGEIVAEMGLGTKIASILPLIIAWIVSAVMKFIWDFKAYGYQFELLYRVGITPVALADIYSGQNANAVKWLKGFIGLALYGVSFIVIPRLGVAVSVEQFRKSIDALTSGSAMGLFTMLLAFVGMLIVPIAELAIMGTIKQVCKEALQ